MRYQHRSVMWGQVLGAILVGPVVLWSVATSNPNLVSICLIGVVFWGIYTESVISVSSDDERLTVTWGIGWPKDSFRYEQIHSVAALRRTPFWSLGYTRWGMWSFPPFQNHRLPSVGITILDSNDFEKTYRIPTDDPAGLRQFVEDRIGRAREGPGGQ